jgi:toxin ParE1/3/4
VKAVRFSIHAERDLVEIAEFISLDNPGAAETMIDAIESVCDGLADFPMKGRAVPQRPPLRRLVVRPYLVFYLIKADEAVIVRILHGSRDIDSLLASDTEHWSEDT